MNDREQPQDSRPSGVFATTRWSIVLVAARPDAQEGAEALDWLCRVYWPAVFQFVRRTVADPEAARDLTQAFFAKLLDKKWLNSADRTKGRFRTFLLTMVKRFLADQHDYEMAQKRGGRMALLSLDQFADEEQHGFEHASWRTPEQEFDRRWAFSVLDQALASLRNEAVDSGQGELFAACQGFLTPGETPDTVSQIARRFALGESAMKMRLHRWRTRYRELIRQEVAETVPHTLDLDEEMKHLLAALAS